MVLVFRQKRKDDFPDPEWASFPLRGSSLAYEVMGRERAAEPRVSDVIAFLLEMDGPFMVDELDGWNYKDSEHFVIFIS